MNLSFHREPEHRTLQAGRDGIHARLTLLQAQGACDESRRWIGSGDWWQPWIGVAAARLATDMGAEVAIAGCSLEKRIQAEQELGQAQTIVMNITDEGTVEQGMAGPSQVDHGPISAGTMRNRATAHRGGAGP